jgi:hypothetical protein
MINYLVPNDIKKYLESKVRDLIQIDAILAKLNQMMIEGSALTKKQNAHQTFYTFKVDYGRHAHRAVFELVTMNNKPYFLLRDFVWGHHYRPALTWRPLGNVTSEVVCDLFKDEYQIISSAQELLPDQLSEEAPDNEVYYHGRWLALTPLQQQVMDGQEYPALLIGPPGSGKTLIAMGMLQERALLHYENQNDDVLRLLYITESPILVEQTTAQWRDFCAHTFPQRYSKVVVDFMTNDAYMREYARSAGLHIDEALLSNLSAYEKAELLHNAYYLHQDVQQNNHYETSQYQSVGKRNSLFSEQQQAQVYAKLCKIIKQSIDNRIFLPGVSLMPVSSPVYDFILVDEAQKGNLALLVGLLHASNQQQVLYVGDALQKGSDYFSSLASLRACAFSAFKSVKLPVHQLQATLRMKADVAQIINEVVKLYGHINGGKADAVSYAHIGSEQEKPTKDASHVHLCPPLQTHIHDEAIQQRFIQDPKSFSAARMADAQQAHNASIDKSEQESDLCRLGLDAQAAAIVLTPTDSILAKILIQGSNVFTAQEARGLEFSHTLVYLSSQTLCLFRNVASLMKSKQIGVEQYLEPLENQSPNKEKKDNESLSLLSDLLVALSRTRGDLYVYMEEPESIHALSPFLPWFKKRLGGDIGSAKIHSTESSQEEWLEAIHRYIAQGLMAQAEESLMRIFSISQEEAVDYIELCRMQAPKASLEEFMSWHQHYVTLPQPCLTVATNHEQSPKSKKKNKKKQHVDAACELVESLCPSQPEITPSVEVSKELKLEASSRSLYLNIFAPEPRSPDEAGKDRILQLVDSLKSGFTYQRFAVSLNVIGKLDSKFWESDLAKGLVSYIAIQPEAQRVVCDYCASCDFSEDFITVPARIHSYLSDSEESMQFKHMMMNLVTLRTKYVHEWVNRADYIEDKFCLVHAIVYKRNKIDLIELARLSKSALNRSTFKTKNTALSFAIQLNYVDMLTTLIGLGADVHQSLSNGQNLAHVAVEYGRKETIQNILSLLVSSGVDINHFDADGLTPADLAVNLKRDDIAHFIERFGRHKTGRETATATSLSEEETAFAVAAAFLGYK